MNYLDFYNLDKQKPLHGIPPGGFCLSQDKQKPLRGIPPGGFCLSRDKQKPPGDKFSKKFVKSRIVETKISST